MSNFCFIVTNFAVTHPFFKCVHTELWTINGDNLPELTDLLTAITMPEKTLEKHKEASDIYVWYYDVFIPAAVNIKSQFGSEVRHYKLYTDKVNVYGKEMVAVHPNVEAYALLVYDNCRNKWKFQYEEKKKNPNCCIDAHCEENRGKYTYFPKGAAGSKARSASVCGFNKAGLDKFSELLTFVKQERKKDADADMKNAKLALKLMRLKHNIKEGTASVPASNKRRRVENTAPTLPPVLFNDNDDEE